MRGGGAAEMAKVKKVLNGVMRCEGSKMLFNKPVDPVALGLPDYFDVIKNPMDLGTVWRGLEESEKSGWKSGPYTNPARVLANVQMVWENCYTYNCRECDKPTRSICDDVQRTFKRAWQEAGLEYTEEGGRKKLVGVGFRSRERAEQWVDEQDVPEAFSINADGLELPLRVLDNFRIQCRGGRGESVALSELELNGTSMKSLVAEGTVLGPKSLTGGRDPQGADRVPVRLKALVDWCVQYGDAPGVWLLTKHAWYKLRFPAPDYEDKFSATLQKCSLSVQVFENYFGAPNASGRNDENVVEKLVANILDDAEAVNGEREFAKKQLQSYIKQVSQSAPSSRKRQAEGGSRMGGSLPNSRGTGQEADQDVKGKAERSASRKRPRSSSLTPSVSFCSSDVKRFAHAPAGSSDPPLGGAPEEKAEKHPYNTGVSYLADLPMTDLRDGHEEGGRDLDPAVKPTRMSSRQRTASLKIRIEKGDGSGKGSLRLKVGQISGGKQKVDPSLGVEDVEEAPSTSFTTTKPRSNRRRGKMASLNKLSSAPTSATVSPAPSSVTLHSSGTHPGPTSNTRCGNTSDSEEKETGDPSFDPSFEASPATARRRPHFNFTEVSDESEEDGEFTLSKSRHGRKASESERRRLRRARESREKSRREQHADEARGDPPDANTGFRVAREFQGDVLSVWEFLMAFSDIFHLPPFPLWRLESALCPIPARRSPQEKAAQSIMGQTDQVHLSSQQDNSGGMADPLKLKIRFTGMHSTPSPIGHSVGASLPMIEPATISAGVLLRDIHLALVRIVETKVASGAVGNVPVRQAKLEEEEKHMDHWVQRVSLCLLRASIDTADEDTKVLAQFLQTHSYVDVDIKGRLRILKALLDMALSTDLLREHINSIVEICWSQRNKKTEDGSDPGLEASAALPPPIASNLPDAIYEDSEKWMKWVESCKLGVSKILGEDKRGNRYWVLGGRGGSWKVYVERHSHSPYPRHSDHQSVKHKPHVDPQSTWGWYEGDGIARLLQWLKEGGAECEKELVKMLEKIPEASSQFPDLFAQPGSGVAMQPSTDQVDNLRPDGYQSVVAPLLRGEENFPELNYATALEARILVCVQSLLAALPFWLDEGHLGARMCTIIEGLKAARTPFDMSRELANAEQLLYEVAVLTSQWGSSWRHDWRVSVLRCTSIQDVALHLCTLQEFLAHDPHRMHRPAFNACAGDARCPLYFPVPNENVVFLKTGCQLHLQKYLNLPQDGPIDAKQVGELEKLSSPGVKGVVVKGPAPLQTETVTEDVKGGEPVKNYKDLVIALEKVTALKPVERFRVSCIAHRSLYPSEYPKAISPRESIPNLPDPPQLPCMWLLMEPLKLRPGTRSPTLSVPIHIDNSLPDYVVKVGPYDQGTRKQWMAGERFRMFFGGKGRQGGVYYKGTVVSVNEIQPGQPYDPWESVTVTWDSDNSESSLMKVSPWEIEIDPEEQKRIEEERRREEEAKARAARAAAKQLRTDHLTRSGGGGQMEPLGPCQLPSDPDYDPEIESSMPSRSRRRGSAIQDLVYYDPNNPVGPIPEDVIQALPEKEGFVILMNNFMRRLKGKFKCPIFAGHELDLHKVFHEVQLRGGYERVTQLKLWKDVCRTLNVDLTGQTSASYNMRLNYEKCLLDFEHYLATGEYSREVADGTAPSCAKLENTVAKPKTGPVPGQVQGVAAPSVLCGSHLQMQPGMGYIGLPAIPEGGGQMSMTELLLADGLGSGFTSPGGVSLGGPAPANQPAIGLPSNPPWLRMVAPRSSKVASSQLPAPGITDPQVQGWVEHPSSIPPPIVSNPENNPGAVQSGHAHSSKLPLVEIQPGESIGMALNRMGRALIGCEVWRRWPEHGGWFCAQVAGFRQSSNEHCLVYEKGMDGETMEWVDLRELESEELCQVDPEPSPTPPSVRVPLKLAPQTPNHTFGHTPGQIDPAPALTHQTPIASLGTPPALHQFGSGNPVPVRPGFGNLGGLVPTLAGNAVQEPSGDLISQLLRAGLAPEVLTELINNPGRRVPLPVQVQTAMAPPLPDSTPAAFMQNSLPTPDPARQFGNQGALQVHPPMQTQFAGGLELPGMAGPSSQVSGLGQAEEGAGFRMGMETFQGQAMAVDGVMDQMSGPIEVSNSFAVLPGFDGGSGSGGGELTSLLLEESPIKDTSGVGITQPHDQGGAHELQEMGPGDAVVKGMVGELNGTDQKSFGVTVPILEDMDAGGAQLWTEKFNGEGVSNGPELDASVLPVQVMGSADDVGNLESGQQPGNVVDLPESAVGDMESSAEVEGKLSDSFKIKITLPPRK